MPEDRNLGVTPQGEDFSAWYNELVLKAELADRGPVRGTMVIRPYGYRIWELLQAQLDQMFKDTGHENAYFPLFIPQSYLQREADHVEGFAPEVAVVTHAGGKELEEPVVVRPTSETVIGEMFSKWISSYRDLPLLINQWANVVRWELRPRAFLRTSEFLWQEGHTAHATEDDARRYAERILHEVYEDFMVNVLAVPIVAGRKTARERFAGAVNTMTCEGMMRDGKALQMATSHELGQNFARAFETRYLNERGELEYVWTTSWGASTRLVGALIMAHGDDAGLRVPPRLAPIQVVVLVVRAGEGAAEAAAALSAELRGAGLRAELDDRADVSFGRRAIDWELKGVPVRLEIGPRDLAEGRVVLVRRDSGDKTAVPLAGAVVHVVDALAGSQRALFEEALARRESGTEDAETPEEAREASETGFARIPWQRLGVEGEAKLAEAAVSVRCLLRPDGSLPQRDDEPDLVAITARAY
jgi:prolyl-tRNA synthetase